MTTHLQTGNGGRRRPARPGFSGVAAALVALCLQLLAAGLYLPLGSADASGGRADLVRLYGEHAVCLAASTEAPNPTAPAEKAPATPVHHLGICCPGHASLSPSLPPPAAVEPIAFAAALVCFPAAASAAVAARPFANARARAPPLDA